MARALVIPHPAAPPELADEAPPPAGGGPELRLVAAEVLPLDRQVAAGRIPGLPFPLRPGQVGVFADASGQVLSLQGGPLGYGLGGPQGTFADCVAAPAGALVPLPDGLHPEVAAAGVTSVLSARLALAAAAVGPGDRVAVTGATGGVGRACVELAAARGLHVVAIARRPADVATRSGVTVIGVDEVAEAGPFDAIVDTVAGPQLAALIAAGAPGCRHVVVGYAEAGAVELSLPSLLLREHRLVGFNAYRAAPDELRAAHVQALADLATGAVSPYPYRAHGLADAATAYAPVQGERTLLVP